MTTTNRITTSKAPQDAQPPPDRRARTLRWVRQGSLAATISMVLVMGTNADAACDGMPNEEIELDGTPTRTIDGKPAAVESGERFSFCKMQTTDERGVRMRCQRPDEGTVTILFSPKGKAP